MLQRLNNPSQLPQGVVEGYQQQNYNMAAARVGLDTTNPFDNGTTITVPIGGVVEVNGVMFRITSPVSMQKPNTNTVYWIEVAPSNDGSTATLGLVTRPGEWNPERQGCYGSNNRRTLNWASLGNEPSPLPTTLFYEWRPGLPGSNTIQLRRGWYWIISNATGWISGLGSVMTGSVNYSYNKHLFQIREGVVNGNSGVAELVFAKSGDFIRHHFNTNVAELFFRVFSLGN